MIPPELIQASLPSSGRKEKNMDHELEMQTLAESIIIIQPGSMYLKIGRASDPNPHMELHAIGRRRTPKGGTHIDSLLPLPLTDDKEIEVDVDHRRLQISHSLQTFIMADGQKRYATPPQQISQFNKRSTPEILNHSGPPWPHIASDVVVGNEVFYLSKDSGFNIHFPVKRGDLNVHTGVGGSLTGVLADLLHIWSHVVERKLSIPLKDLKNYKAVVIIPDVYNRQFIREYPTLLFEMGFSSCLLLQDHVAATFSAGLGAACVIDCGHGKTSISCVEDGISHPATRIRLPFGGGDISHCLLWLMRRGGFPYKECSLQNSYDGLLIERLKQESCHLDLNVCGSREKNFVVRQPGKPVVKYTMQMGDECMIAPLGIFHPELFQLTVPRGTVATQKRATSDPSDPHDADYFRETGRKGAKEQESAPDNINDEEIIDIEMSGDSDFNLGQHQLMSLDQAIVQSIQRCGSEDTKRKMCTSVLLVGGGLKFKGINSWIRSKLENSIPSLKLETAEIVKGSKEIDPVVATWRGAAIFVCLESAQELWIAKEEFEKYATKILRERSAFIW